MEGKGVDTASAAISLRNLDVKARDGEDSRRGLISSMVTEEPGEFGGLKTLEKE